ncbi:MAG: DUF302 domain-containing protein [Geminicoccaceae bacterium]|nr:DUF302 domain-containing protein [Geminicoccaceae bacterium]
MHERPETASGTTRLAAAFAAAVAGLLFATTAGAGPLPETREGWSIHPAPHDWQQLGERLGGAIERSPLNELSRASATRGAQSLGVTIAGNLVVHAFAPQFAVRMLEASIAAGYEAPLRFYVTENADGTATLSYALPSHLFAAYEDGGEALDALAAELDDIMAQIAAEAVAP